jgi:hypothetical protein
VERFSYQEKEIGGQGAPLSYSTLNREVTGRFPIEGDSSFRPVKEHLRHVNKPRRNAHSPHGRK